MKLYRFHWNCGRMGDLEGTFVATEKEVENAHGKNVYFGEVLGKHSEIYGKLSMADYSVVKCEPGFAEEFARIFGSLGYNPLDYIQCDVCYNAAMECGCDDSLIEEE